MKSVFRIKWLIPILVSFACSAFALDVTPEGIYAATYEACSSVSENDIAKSIFALQSLGSALHQDRLLRGYFPSASFNEMIRSIQSDSTKAVVTRMDVTTLSPYARNILASSSFEQALTDCYSQATAPKEFFRKSILRADTRGKVLGSLIVLTALKGFGIAADGFGALIKSWSTGLYQTLSLAQKTYSGLIATSFLRGDTETPEAQPPVLNLSSESPLGDGTHEMTTEEFQKASSFILNLSKIQLQTLNRTLMKESDPKLRTSISKQIEQTKKQIREIENSLARNGNH